METKFNNLYNFTDRLASDVADAVKAGKLNGAIAEVLGRIDDITISVRTDESSISSPAHVIIHIEDDVGHSDTIRLLIPDHHGAIDEVLGRIDDVTISVRTDESSISSSAYVIIHIEDDVGHSDTIKLLISDHPRAGDQDGTFRVDGLYREIEDEFGDIDYYEVVDYDSVLEDAVVYLGSVIREELALRP